MSAAQKEKLRKEYLSFGGGANTVSNETAELACLAVLPLTKQ